MATANPATSTDDRRRSSPHDRSDREPGRHLDLRAAFGDHPLAGLVRAAAFWAAVVLPFASLALLLGPGVHTPADAAVLVGLLVGNVVAVVCGHDHRS